MGREGNALSSRLGYLNFTKVILRPILINQLEVCFRRVRQTFSEIEREFNSRIYRILQCLL